MVFLKSFGALWLHICFQMIITRQRWEIPEGITCYNIHKRNIKKKNSPNFGESFWRSNNKHHRWCTIRVCLVRLHSSERYATRTPLLLLFFFELGALMKIISPPSFASLLFCDDKCNPCIGAQVPFKTSEYTMESQRSRQRRNVWSRLTIH
jgi:hypothetical protein